MLDLVYGIFVTVKAVQFFNGGDFISAAFLKFSYGVVGVNGALLIGAAVYMFSHTASKFLRKRYIEDTLAAEELVANSVAGNTGGSTENNG
jgi:hypothetical protein